MLNFVEQNELASWGYFLYPNWLGNMNEHIGKLQEMKLYIREVYTIAQYNIGNTYNNN